MRHGFQKEQLRNRYDVSTFAEDCWHAYCGTRTRQIIVGSIPANAGPLKSILNAGSGVYRLDVPGWTEFPVDLFEAPLSGRSNATCANIEALPFTSATFNAIVCVGEVLGYCDPQLAFKEFSRVAELGSTLICDFGSTMSFRYFSLPCHGREADIVVDTYNRTEERVWVYHPRFIKRLLNGNNFRVTKEYGTHTWSALARRFGASSGFATGLQRRLEKIRLPVRYADVCTIVAERI